MSQSQSARSGISDSFESGVLNPIWQPWATGTGRLEYAPGTLHCVLDPASRTKYSDAQITDYHGRPRRDYPWRPPLHMHVRAWASHPTHELKGTAGFGFWNEPFVPVGGGLPRLPRAAWFFFGSPPNNMALAKDIPGRGWKAATLDTSRLPALLLAPLALPGFVMMRIPALYRVLWPIAQRAIGASEALLDVDLIDPHDYELVWRDDSVTFNVDGHTVHHAPTSPSGPLGFIAWMDNQYAVVTPQGRFKFGQLDTPAPQWLTLDQIDIHPI